VGRIAASRVLPGLQAVVTQVMPARNRVTVLLEFIGGQTAAKLRPIQVLREGNERSGVL